MIDSRPTRTADPKGRLSRAFLAYGRIGFWVQFVFLIVVSMLGLYVFSIAGPRARAGNLLALLGLALPLFTTWWCWRYGQFGRRLAQKAGSVPSGAAARMAWIGTWAGTAGMVVSLLSLFGAASALLVVMLANPQVGIQVSAAVAGASSYNISAVDAVSIMSLLIALTAELLVVALSLRLVFLASATARDAGT